MNIDVDQAVPRKDMVLQEDGKYIYVDQTNSKFDIDKFNRYYEQYRERRRATMQTKMQEKLAELNRPRTEIPVYNQSVPKIILDVKDSLFNLLDDLLQGKIELETFFKNNRLFYLGITLIFIAIFVYVYGVLITDDDPKQQSLLPLHVDVRLIK
jgi:hypothetical protein